MGSVLWIKYMLDVWNLYCCLVVPIFMIERFQKQMLGFDIVLRWKIHNHSNKEWKSLHALVKSVWENLISSLKTFIINKEASPTQWWITVRFWKRKCKTERCPVRVARARVPSAAAAARFGPTPRAAARHQARVSSFGDLALSKHHGAFELLLDFPDPSEHLLQVGSAVQRERVMLRRIGLQVKQEWGVVDLQACEHWAVLVWGGAAVGGTWCTQEIKKKQKKLKMLLALW